MIQILNVCYVAVTHLIRFTILSLQTRVVDEIVKRPMVLASDFGLKKH